MAPPDIEAGTAPVEATSTGVVVVDADLLFMGEGPLPSPVVLHVADGEMVGVEGAEAGRLEEMLARCADERMTNLAEVSMAFNPVGPRLRRRDGDRVGARHRARRARQLDRVRRHRRCDRAPGLRDA